MSTSTTIDEVMHELAALEDPQMREANERRGDDHGVNLTSDTSACLLATLVCRP
jgi:hypothetical protein